MIKAKYESVKGKLDNLAEEHDLICVWDTESKYITLTVRPQAIQADQTSFIEDKTDDKSSGDAALSIIFKDAEITISTTGKLFITEALVNKFKNIAKKMHYLYLQLLREEWIGTDFSDDSYDLEDCDEAEEINEQSQHRLSAGKE